MKQKKSVFQLTSAMIIFGSIGLFRRLLPFASGVIAASRGLIGGVFLLAFCAAARHRLELGPVWRHLPCLLLSGVCLGVNWVFLFEAYRFTSVAAATVCYYMGPVFAAAAAVFLFRERLTGRKLICMALSVAGIILISGSSGSDSVSLRGILLALAAAAFYGSVMILNRYTGEVGAYERTIVQLLTSALAVGAYAAFIEHGSSAAPGAADILLLLLIGIVHTGVAYTLFFGSVGILPTQSSAVISYVDPAVSVLLSAVLLDEPMTVLTVSGILLVLGSAVFSELSPKRVSSAAATPSNGTEEEDKGRKQEECLRSEHSQR